MKADRPKSTTEIPMFSRASYDNKQQQCKLRRGKVMDDGAAEPINCGDRAIRCLMTAS